MFELFYPGQRVATQHHVWQWAGFIVESVFVLHLIGSGLVDNLRLWDNANYAQVLNISCSAFKDGATQILSSLYPNKPMNIPFTQ